LRVVWIIDVDPAAGTWASERGLLFAAEFSDALTARAVDTVKTAQAYRGYAKETMRRALAATRKRHAHLLAQRQLEEQSSTEFPNGGRSPFPNAPENHAGTKPFR